MDECEIDFIRAKSYAGITQGTVKITKSVEIDISRKDVYLVDDIFDSGETMKFLAKYFNLKGAKTIHIVTLVKRAKNEFNPINPHSHVSTFRHAFQCDDEWLIGYGMDSTGGYKRNLKSIFAL